MLILLNYLSKDQRPSLISTINTLLPENYKAQPAIDASENIEADIIQLIKNSLNSQQKGVKSDWEKVLPNYIINIKYEDLVMNTEKEIRNLLDKCGLSWNSNCLNFYKNKLISYVFRECLRLESFSN